MQVSSAFSIWIKVIIVALLCGAVGILISPFWVPLVLGSLLTVVLMPIYKLVLKRVKKPHYASLLTSTIFCFIIVIPTVLFGIRSAQITTDFLTKVTQQQNNGESVNLNVVQNKQISEWSEQIEALLGFDLPAPDALFKKAVVWGGQFLLEIVSQFFAALPELSISFIIAILVVYFALIHHQYIQRLIAKYSFLRLTNARVMMRGMSDACRVIIVANVSTGAVQSFLIAVAAALSGAGEFFVVGFITFILSFVPVVGAAPVGLVLALIQAFNGNYGVAIFMAVVALLVGAVDNILRPFLMSDSNSNVPAFFSLLSVLGGVFLFGLPGLFLGPLIMSFASVAIPLYLKELGFD